MYNTANYATVAVSAAREDVPTITDMMAYVDKMVANAINPIQKREKMPVNAKTLLTKSEKDKLLHVMISDADGNVGREVQLMPDINEVKILKSGDKNKVVFVTFSDATTEKAVLSDNDTFSLEQAISICVAKKLFSMKVGDENGSSIYNKIVNRGLKVFEHAEKVKGEKEKADVAQREKLEKLAEKKRNKRLKREAEEYEAYIEAEKEAIIRALRELNNTSEVIAAN